MTHIAKILMIFAVILCFLPNAAFSQSIAYSFSKAKKLAEEEVYHDRRISFYCGCSYTKNKVVNQESCGYEPRTPITSSGRENKRDNRIEWEHVLPASIMGSNLQCWGSERNQFSECVKSNGKLLSGRDCCQKVNPLFKDAHNDLVNLTPAIGEVNADRSNHRYGYVDGEPRKYGQCDFEFENNVAEPSVTVRGDIARIQLHMLKTYGKALGFHFTDKRLLMLQHWAGQDPVTDWELIRNRRICAAQGVGNTLIGDCD